MTRAEKGDRKRIKLQRREISPKFTLLRSLMSASLCALNAARFQRVCPLGE